MGALVGGGGISDSDLCPSAKLIASPSFCHWGLSNVRKDGHSPGWTVVDSFKTIVTGMRKKNDFSCEQWKRMYSIGDK